MRRVVTVLVACLLLAACGAKPAAVPASKAACSLPMALAGYPEAEMTVEDTVTYDGVAVSAIRYRLEKRDSSEDWPHPIVVADLRFPQVSGIPQTDRINSMLLDAALKSAWGYDIDASDAAERFQKAEDTHVEGVFSWSDLVGEVDFATLHCDGRYLSVLFSGSNTYYNGVNMTEQVLTIDLEQAAWVYLAAFTDFERLLDGIRMGVYEVLSGYYLPGGWEGPEMCDVFADALVETAAEDYLLEYRPVTAEGSPLTRELEPAQGLVEYPVFDNSTSQNFGTDGESLWIRFDFYDSLNGYVLLKVPLDGLEKK